MHYRALKAVYGQQLDIATILQFNYEMQYDNRHLTQDFVIVIPTFQSHRPIVYFKIPYNVTSEFLLNQICDAFITLGIVFAISKL